MTKTPDQLRAEILTAMDATIGEINAALLVAKDDEVIYCWLNYGLGVQLDGAGKTIRKAALRKALESAQASRTHLATMPLEA